MAAVSVTRNQAAVLELNGVAKAAARGHAPRRFAFNDDPIRFPIPGLAVIVTEDRLQANGIKCRTLGKSHQEPAVLKTKDARIVHAVLSVVAHLAPGLAA